MSYFSALDLTLRGIDADRRVKAWSEPTLSIHLVDDASLARAIPWMWRGQVNRFLTVEWWCMAPGVWMGEEATR